MHSARFAQLETRPKPIDLSAPQAERMRVLKELATILPQLGRRHQLTIVGKGGSLLHLCEGVERPTTDYDCDTSKVLARDLQGQLLQQALRSIEGVFNPTVTVPANRSQPVKFGWNARLATGQELSPVDSFINTKHVNDLNDPKFREQHVRLQDGMLCYASERLYEGKVHALTNRTAARDLYDTWYGLTHHLDRIAPATRIRLATAWRHQPQLDAKFLQSWNRDLEKDGGLRNRVNIEEMILGIMECLDGDPVVALQREPRRKPAFVVDNRARTMAFGLAGPDPSEPFRTLYKCGQSDDEVRTLCTFIVGSRVDIWPALKSEQPKGGTADGISKLMAICAEQVRTAGGRTPGQGAAATETAKQAVPASAESAQEPEPSEGARSGADDAETRLDAGANLGPDTALTVLRQIADRRWQTIQHDHQARYPVPWSRPPAPAAEFDAVLTPIGNGDTELHLSVELNEALGAMNDTARTRIAQWRREHALPALPGARNDADDQRLEWRLRFSGRDECRSGAEPGERVRVEAKALERALAAATGVPHSGEAVPPHGPDYRYEPGGKVTRRTATARHESSVVRGSASEIRRTITSSHVGTWTPSLIVAEEQERSRPRPRSREI